VTPLLGASATTLVVAYAALVATGGLAEPASGGRFNVNCSGFGLKPNGFAECGARWEEPGFYIEEYASGQAVAANGTWPAPETFHANAKWPRATARKK
jgi:hypothetical protein